MPSPTYKSCALTQQQHLIMCPGRTPSRTPGERIFKTTKSCSITSITHLRRELGFGARGEERDIAFKRAVRKQITTFVSSSDSIPAYKFTKWKNTVHQRGLLEVTKDFLDVQGKGSEFWPQSDLSDTTQPLQYWKDSAKSVEILPCRREPYLTLL